MSDNPFKWAGLALLGLGAIGLLAVPFYLFRDGPSTTTVATPAHTTQVNAPAATTATPAVQAFPINQSQHCTGMQPVQSLTEEEKGFNPFGCYVYWKPSVVGTITLVGVSLVGLPVSKDIRSGTTEPSSWTFYKAKAKGGTGRAEWQPMLCVGEKKDLSTNDCR